MTIRKMRLLRNLKERFKRLQRGRAWILVSIVGSIQQSIVRGEIVRLWRDQDGDWWNQTHEATFVAPELITTSMKSASEIVHDRWLWNFELTPGDVVIDVGAGIGDDALVFSRLVGPSGKVIAIEAHPATYRCLCKTISANELQNVTALPVAAADADSILKISDQSNYLSNSIMGSQVGVEVPTRRLDDLIAELGLPQPTLVKFNIEGAETAALAGMPKIAERGTRLVVSCHDFKAERGDGEHFRTSLAVRELLDRANYLVLQRREDPRREVYWIAYGEKRPCQSE